MILLILRLLIAVLLALTGVVAEDTSLRSEEVVTETCDPINDPDPENCDTGTGSTTPPPLVLPGPSA